MSPDLCQKFYSSPAHVLLISGESSPADPSTARVVSRGVHDSPLHGCLFGF